MSTKRRPVEMTRSAILEEFYSLCKSKPYFAGVDFGQRRNRARGSDAPCLRFHAKIARPASLANIAQDLPALYAGFPVEIIGAQYDAQGNVGSAAGPCGHLAGGVPCSNGISHGQISIMVAKRDTDRAGFLTSWYAGSGPGVRVGAPVLAHRPTGRPAPKIGVLSEIMLDRYGAASFVVQEENTAWLPIVQPSNATVTALKMARVGEEYRVGQTYGKVDGVGIYRIAHEIQPGVWKDIDIEGHRILAEHRVASGALVFDEATATGAGLVSANGGRENGKPVLIASSLPRVFAGLGLRLATFDDLTRGSQGIWPQKVIPCDAARTEPASPLHQAPVSASVESPFWSDDAETGHRDFAAARQTQIVSENHRLDVPTVLWPMLRNTLLDQGYKVRGITDRVERLDPTGGHLLKIAAAINNGAAFWKLGLRDIMVDDIAYATTFDQICERLNDIIDRCR